MVSRKLKFRILIILIVASLVILYLLCLPVSLFDDPTSTVIEDRNGILIGARIAADGQWRFPYRQDIPDKFKKSITQFEDRYFFKHPGINLFSLLRATVQNIRAGRIVSGGSTITMQVIRLTRKSKPRTVWEKLIEILLAVRIEIKYSKSEILALYASHAPFGGNVVGLEAAAWRYFGRAPDDLSWAEAALLAVLPNAPSLIYPGKNHEKLAAKRNKLINRLIEREFIDPESGRLAMKEELPGKPLPLEQAAPHLLDRIFKEKPGQLCRTTIEYSKQKAVAEIIEIHHRELNFSEINNAAALVLETESGNVLAYVGNTQSPDTSIHGNDVDIILAPRSTGSILKPLLYAAMLDDGEILPNTLIADIPTRFGGMTPQNFDGSFAGAVPASKALYQSLNVPAVRLLQRFGVQHFYDVLKKCGFTTLSRPPDHYGLSLILGGAETTLWDLASAYSGMARELNHYAGNNGKYDPRDWHPPVYFLNNNPEKNPGEFSREANLIRDGILSASAVWFTFKAMKEVNRPPDYFGWKSFSSSSAIAWKTGTSFGFRDAWALGVTPEYIVAVWVGNADGEGRSGLTGIATAAPILFDIFNILPETSWFDPPYDDMARAAVCRQSGQRANPYCEPVDTTWIPAQGTKSSACIYHHLIHLDKTGKYRVTDACYPPSEMVHVSWFILPPVMEWYYKKLNPLYRNLPSLYSGCESDMSTSLMEFIYPADHNKIYLPIDLDGTKGSVILEVAHRNPHSTVFWHIDNDYLGMTTGIHQLEVCPSFGKHNLTVTDERGSSVTREIEILEPDSQK